MPIEWPLMRPGQIVFTYFHFAADEVLTKTVMASGITAVAYETIRDEHGRTRRCTCSPPAQLNRNQNETRRFRSGAGAYTIRRYSPDKEPHPGDARLRVELATWGQCWDDLRCAALHADQPRTRERFPALSLIGSGQFNATAGALHLGRPDETVLGWRHRSNAQGPDALTYRRSGGRCPLLTNNRRSGSLRPSSIPSRPTTAGPAPTGR